MNRVVRTRGETITLATTRALATVRGIPPGFNAIDLNATSSTIENILVLLGPKIGKMYFYDDSRGTWTDFTSQATDRNTASLVDVSAMQTADRLYVGGTNRYEGLAVDVVGTNGAGTATATWEYPTAGTWSSLSATDGTNSTATLDQDGVVTWTSPANNLWVAATLNEVAGEQIAAPATERYWWTRMRPSVALTDTSITQGQYTLLASDTLNALTGDNLGQDDIRFQSNNGTLAPYRLMLDTRRYGSIELLSTSITSAANLNWLVLRR